MTLLVLLILAVIWAAVLLPPYLQNRSESRPADSISSFQRQLSVLERRAGTINDHPRSAARAARRPADAVMFRAPAPAVTATAAYRLNRAEAKRRRREVLFTLAGAASITFALALFLGGPVWGLNLLCDIGLGTYVVLLAQTNQREIERTAKVRYLPKRSRQPEPALLLRRSGS